MTIKISENFNLEDYFVSVEYPEIAKTMSVQLWQLENIWTLNNMVIQPVRKLLAEPLRMLSGLRTEGLNKLIDNSSKTSDHMLGAAADITSKKIQLNPMLIANLINNERLPTRQIIFYPEKGFIHLSINVPQQAGKKNQFLAYKSGSYQIVT